MPVPSVSSFAQTTLTAFFSCPLFLETLYMSIPELQQCQLFCCGSVILIMSLISIACEVILGLPMPHLLAYRHWRAVSGHPTSSKECKKIPHQSVLCSLCLILNKPSSFGNQPQKPSGPESKTFSLD